MEINITDYLSEEEIKDIITDTVRTHVRSILGNNVVSFANQFARQVTKEEVQTIIPNYEELIDNHIKEKINSITLGDLFFESLGWKSQGNKIFNKVLANNEALIEKR